MTHSFVHLGGVSLLVAIDNALLTGLLLPRQSGRQRLWIVLYVGVAIGVAQVFFAMGVAQLLERQLFRAMAILILAWMAAKTINRPPTDRRSVVSWQVLASVFFYTVVGNLDNLILLGTEVKAQFGLLAFFSIATIPLFVVVALFLARESDHHGWVPWLGAGMMAWAAGALFLGTPARQTWPGAPWWLLQGGVAACILAGGVLWRQWAVWRRRAGRGGALWR